ncbi:HPr kinase/phosphorylase [Yoonia sp. 2307UL14-13]|uniref:HPr kinase/phosphorylase n=1 Tax=Yoonia sp. 2307UL14-13 TaxID=3126506 RepID=UPI00309AC91D
MAPASWSACLSDAAAMTEEQTVHATCVAWDDAAVLIQGAAGRGKSALGLSLMGMGCTLVADDRVLLLREGGDLIARAPATIRGIIEARGVGILQADCVDRARVVLTVDLDHTETRRLPERRQVMLLRTEIPLIRHIEGPHLASSILQILKAGWSQR